MIRVQACILLILTHDQTPDTKSFTKLTKTPSQQDFTQLHSLIHFRTNHEHLCCQQEEKCHWYLNLTFSLMAKPLDLHPTSHKIFKTFSMIAYINKSQKQKSLVFISLNFTVLNQVTKLKSVYFCTKLRLKFFRGGKCIRRLLVNHRELNYHQ